MNWCEGISGCQAEPFLDKLADLRCRVFREFPYLYDGDPDAEVKYLANYAKNPDVFLVIAKHGDEVVGVSTCMPMRDADPAFQKPFLDMDIPIDDICYFGESVLLQEYRGRGIGHQFFDLREAWSLERKFATVAFCSVVRDPKHPNKPNKYRSHDHFWLKRGFVKHPELVCSFDWLEIDSISQAEVPHELVFWTKALP
ncbi:MAG: GNAT family N-acetyltransferase [Akkermansiaceae bacterium]